MSMKLYRVTCRGMKQSIAGNAANGLAYVVTGNPHTAYQFVRDYLEKNDLGFRSDRALDKVELIAEESDSPDCGFRLFL